MTRTLYWIAFQLLTWLAFRPPPVPRRHLCRADTCAAPPLKGAFSHRLGTPTLPASGISVPRRGSASEMASPTSGISVQNAQTSPRA